MSESPPLERGATRVAIVGLGAIGGSVALKLRERGVTPEGFTANADDLQLAAKAGVRAHATVADAVKDVDLVLIATPMDQLASVAGIIVSAAPDHATILHAASLHRPDATRLDPATASRVVGTHPLAGTEGSGFAAARPDLFQGATVLVETRASGAVREDAELFWSMAGASRIEFLGAREHDDLMAGISHLPQLVATALAATLSSAGVHRSALGPGGRDMTRLAGSAWSMWRPLLAGTPARTAALLSSLETELRQIREDLERSSLDETALTWSVAHDWYAAARRPEPRP